MKKENLFSEGFWNEIIRMALIILLFISFKKLFEPDEKLAILLRDGIVVVCTSILYSFVFIVKSIVQRPVKVKIHLKHALTKKECYDLYHHDTSNRQDAKRIRIFLKIIQTNSRWNRYAINYIKGKNVTILIEIDPKDNMLICQPVAKTDDVEINKDSFKIIINKLIDSNLKKNIPLNKNYEFIVEENRDMPIHGDQQFCIKPILLVNGKRPGFIANCFIKYINELENGYFPINLYK